MNWETQAQACICSVKHSASRIHCRTKRAVAFSSSPSLENRPLHSESQYFQFSSWELAWISQLTWWASCLDPGPHRAGSKAGDRVQHPKPGLLPTGARVGASFDSTLTSLVFLDRPPLFFQHELFSSRASCGPVCWHRVNRLESNVLLSQQVLGLSQVLSFWAQTCLSLLPSYYFEWKWERFLGLLSSFQTIGNTQDSTWNNFLCPNTPVYFLLLLSLIRSRVFLFTIFLYVKEHVFLGHKCVLSIKK